MHIMPQDLHLLPEIPEQRQRVDGNANLPIALVFVQQRF